MISTRSEETSSQNYKLQHRLRTRHLNTVAIGGVISTGPFVAFDATISQVGPGDALITYALVDIMAWLITQSLGEVAAYLPVSGSFQEYGRRCVSEPFGLAMGWSCWFNWAITVAVGLAATTLAMRYWFPDVSSTVWSALSLAILFRLNALSTRAFDKGEFWLATTKVITVIVFLVSGVGMVFGISGRSSLGFENRTTGGAPFVNGGMGLLVVSVVAGCSFQGTEVVSAAAGEAEDPEHTIPRVIRTIFRCILLFHIGAIAVIGFLIAYTDPNLLNTAEDNISISPFTLVFERAGIVIVAGLINAVILTSVLSAGNSGMYVSTRMLFSLARQGRAPHYFDKFSRRGAPLRVPIAITVIGMAGFVTPLVGDGVAYTFLLTLSALAGLIIWFGISFNHYRFRKYLKA